MSPSHCAEKIRFWADRALTTRERLAQVQAMDPLEIEGKNILPRAIQTLEAQIETYDERTKYWAMRYRAALTTYRRRAA